MFDFAFDLAKTGAKSKMADIHLKYALYLEDEGEIMLHISALFEIESKAKSGQPEIPGGSQKVGFESTILNMRSLDLCYSCFVIT